MKKIHVILRTCVKSGVNLNECDSWKRVCGEDREEMVRRCVGSLVRSCGRCAFPVKITVLDDHSGKSFINYIKGLMKKFDVEWELKSLRSRGFRHSATKVLDEAEIGNPEDLVYMVEDDYLHEESAIECMTSAHMYLTSRFRDKIVIFPFDCPFRYGEGSEQPTVVLSIASRYWRHVTASTFTHMMTRKDLIENIDVYRKVALGYPNETEENTIHRLYKGLNASPEQKLICFSPMPSLAYHLSYVEPVRLNCSHSCWEDLWAEVGAADLGDGGL